MRYTLVGVDGNAFAVMGYTANAMKKAGLGSEVQEMYDKAKSGDYNNLLCVCDGYIQKVNDILGYDDDEEDYDDEEVW